MKVYYSESVLKFIFFTEHFVFGYVVEEGFVLRTVLKIFKLFLCKVCGTERQNKIILRKYFFSNTLVNKSMDYEIVEHMQVVHNKLEQQKRC